MPFKFRMVYFLLMMTEFNQDLVLYQLEWLTELGANEAIGDEEINRLEISKKEKTLIQSNAQNNIGQMQRSDVSKSNAFDVASNLAQQANNTELLREAIQQFDEFEFKKASGNIVFADGVFGSRVMIIGDASSAAEDKKGMPFVDGPGLLLDNMINAIGLSRKKSVYIINALPWRLPARQLREDEILMFQPFLQRHIELANPEFLLLMGALSPKIIWGMEFVEKQRGVWHEVFGKQALVMHHPVQLIQTPTLKREAWQDLLKLKAALES
ncbi:MAG: uracil-DNA glycosylase [Aestuariivita sp.]|nr:uracil-DNA glycosylase [Aestuariivita sp.]